MREILRQIFKRVTLEDSEISYLEKVRCESAKDKKSSIAKDMKAHGQARSVELNIKFFADGLLAAALAKLTFDALPVLETVDFINMAGNIIQSPYNLVNAQVGDNFTGIFIAVAAVLDIKARGLADKQKAISFPELADRQFYPA